MFDLDALIADLQSEVSDDRTKEILELVARDSVMLSTKALSGVDVTRELQVLKATVASLGAQKAATVNNRLQQTVVEVVGGLLNKIFS